MREIVVREEIELVKEVSDVDAAERVHLREGQDAGVSRPKLALVHREKSSDSYICSSRGLSGVYQLTLRTLSNSSSF
jgi:hypothetical protein